MKSIFEKEKKFETWTEGLEQSNDPVTRIEYMQQGLAEDPSDENKWHYEILKKRYCDKKGQVGKVDFFIAAWMDIEEVQRLYKLPFNGKKRAHKLLLDVAGRLMLTEDMSSWEDWKRDTLQKEYEHLIKYYVTLSQDDRMYTGIINGYIKMKDETIRQKLIDDINNVVSGIPALVGEEELFHPLRQALDNIL